MSCYEKVGSGGKTSFSKDCSLWKVCIKWIHLHISLPDCRRAKEKSEAGMRK